MPYLCFRLCDRVGGNCDTGDLVSIYPDHVKFSSEMLKEFGFYHCPDLPDWAEEMLKEPLYTETNDNGDPIPIRSRRKMTRIIDAVTKVPEETSALDKTFTHRMEIAQSEIPEIPWEKLKDLYYDKVDRKTEELKDPSAEVIDGRG